MLIGLLGDFCLLSGGRCWAFCEVNGFLGCGGSLESGVGGSRKTCHQTMEGVKWVVL